jgi:2,3,4,5-tetrahydropyridine-2-carboxylate N-succinyltransferase
MTLRERIEAAFEKRCELSADDFGEFMHMLNEGKIRAAMPVAEGWQVQPWVKKGILLGFRSGVIQDFSQNGPLPFFDKHTFPLKSLTLQDGVRIVPGGSSVRSGCFVGKGVVIMPPAYVNVGAYVDTETMIDSHSLVGSCAQIGKRVHLSAGAQIGGVLEPVGSQPVIIEDDVLVGGNCGVYEGTRVCKGAVLGAGTILTRSIPVYDLVHEQVLRGSPDAPLTIPERAVVVAGSRPVSGNAYAQQAHLHLQCGLIIKYRDANTDRATALEEALR